MIHEHFRIYIQIMNIMEIGKCIYIFKYMQIYADIHASEYVYAHIFDYPKHNEEEHTYAFDNPTNSE